MQTKPPESGPNIMPDAIDTTIVKENCTSKVFISKNELQITLNAVKSAKNASFLPSDLLLIKGEKTSPFKLFNIKKPPQIKREVRLKNMEAIYSNGRALKP